MFSSSRLFENSANSESAKRREAAPRSVAAVQQIVATVIGGYVNHPDVNRTWTIDAIKFVTQPMCKRQNLGAPPSLQGLSAHGRYQRSLRAMEVLRDKLGDQTRDSTSAPTGRSLGRSDPHLLRSNFRAVKSVAAFAINSGLWCQVKLLESSGSRFAIQNARPQLFCGNFRPRHAHLGLGVNLRARPDVGEFRVATNFARDEPTGLMQGKGHSHSAHQHPRKLLGLLNKIFCERRGFTNVTGTGKLLDLGAQSRKSLSTNDGRGAGQRMYQLSQCVHVIRLDRQFDRAHAWGKV